MTDTPPAQPLAYADPEISAGSTKPYDLAVSIASVLQIALASLAVGFEIFLFSQMFRQFGNVWHWISPGFFLGAPLYGLLSAVASAAALPAFQRRRRTLYWIYTAGVLTQSAIGLISMLSTAPASVSLFIAPLFVLFMLIINPTLPVIAFRWLWRRRQRPQSPPRGFDVIAVEPLGDSSD